MPDRLVELFRETVIDPFAVQHAGVADALGYSGYMSLRNEERQGDEANVVDQRFTTAVLSWLGWTNADYDYNAPEPGGGKHVQRPDFRVKSMGVTAFVVEDKSSSLDFDASMLDQMRRYTEGSTGYALWCNAREMRLERFGSGGANETLAIFSVSGLFGPNRVLDPKAEEIALLQIHSVLGKQRFADFPGLLDQACANEDRISLEGDTALREFIEGSRSVLEDVRRGAVVQIRAAFDALSEHERGREDLLQDLQEANRHLIEHGRWSERLLPQAQEAANGARVNIGTLGVDSLRASVETLVSANAKVINAWIEQVMRIDTMWRLREQQRRRQQEIATAYELWSRQQPDQATNVTPETFSEQVAYVLFVRLILVRLLEDKGILPSRLAVDGGFEAWRELVETRFSPTGATTLTEIYGAEFLTMVFRVVGAYYRHFFQQPIFDWYQPDDNALVKLLAHLNRYDFAEITHDVLGFTYENYVERRGKQKKGQFLTRSGVVMYMLDQADYEGRKVIGQRLLDHACGSGSFLIHAARRYRKALAEGMAAAEGVSPELFVSGEDPERRLQFSRKLIDDVTRLLVGIDVDPFACYLAELNLLVQVMDEVSLVWKHDQYAPIERFLVFNSDSLSMPTGVLYGSFAAPAMDVSNEDPLDEAWQVKARQGAWQGGFDYVVANPPYVTPKRQPILDQVRHTPFFQEALSQDLNLYLLFFRLAEHYVSDSGVAVLISPLTLLGDDSAENTRRLLTTHRLRVTGITRFYSGTVLFPGVDQMVMIVRFAAGDENRLPSDVELHGGLTEEQARERKVTVPGSDVVAPPRPEFSPALPDPWTNAWFHVADSDALAVWQHVCEKAGANVHHLLEVSLSPRQGDVNATAVRDLLRNSPSLNRMPAYTAKAAQPLAPLPEPDEWVEVPESASSSGAQATLTNLQGLQNTECGIILQEMINVHVGRRLRATWFERDSGNPKAFLHTLWRFIASAGKERHAKAVLGFLSSGLASYLFGMWSTNNHVQSNVLRRLPCPPLQDFPEEELAKATDAALGYRATLAVAISDGFGRFVPPADIKMNAPALLAASGAPTITLADAELRGILTRLPSRSQKVDRLLDGHLEAQDIAYLTEVTPLIAARGNQQWHRVRNDILLPEPAHLRTFVDFRDQQTERAEQAAADFEASRREIDRIVDDWYELPGNLRGAVNQGLPFSYRNARAEVDDNEALEVAQVLE